MTNKTLPYPAPDFSLISATDQRVSLSDLRGSWLVIYFYPKDDTPGCTVESCSLRDSRAELESLGAKVVGISRDTPEQHRKFIEKYNLSATLLSDPRAEVTQAYGAWGKKMFGIESVIRKTFLVDQSGQVQKVYDKVTPLHHGEQVVADLLELQGKKRQI